MEIQMLNLLWGVLLLAIPGYLIYTCDRLELPRFVLPVVRMLVQMSAMGGCLWLLYAQPRPDVAGLCGYVCQRAGRQCLRAFCRIAS